MPIHLLGGLALLVGFRTRWAAALLALVCLGTAFGVHLPIGDQANMTNFYKNLVMTGGFIYVMVYGAGAASIDKRSTVASRRRLRLQPAATIRRYLADKLSEV